MSVLLLRADARALPLPDASVDLICTSPPYFSLRSYTDGRQHYHGQVGSELTPGEYIDSLIGCTREWMRVLKPTGSLWVNLGDKYAGSRMDGSSGNGKDGSTLNCLKPGYVPPYHENLSQNRGRRATTGGVPQKSLVGLPWRYALRCIDDLGLILRAEVIWSKPNGLPESVTDRVRRSHEQWFWLSTWAPEGPPPDLIRAVLEQVAAGVLTVDEAERLLTLDMTSHEVWFHATKQPRYYSAIDHIREEHAPAGLARRAYTFNVNDAQRASKNPVLNGAGNRPANALGKLPGSVWEIPTEPLTVPEYYIVQGGRTVHYAWTLREAWAWMRSRGVAAGRPSARRMTDHFAAFPTEWPRRIIVGWSPSGICTACGEGRRPVGDVTYQTIVAPTVDRRVAGLAESGHSGRGRGNEARYGNARRETAITGEACICTPSYLAAGQNAGHLDDWSPPSTRPAVILDPFGGTGTAALVAHALGRTGISVDMSFDYTRLAKWRTSDPRELAKAMRVEKPAKQLDGQADLLADLLEGPAA